MTVTGQLDVRFAFDGPLGELLQDCLNRDRAAARLNAKFRMYYRLRSYLPVSIRAALQRKRSKNLLYQPDWYMARDFVEAWKRRLADTIQHGKNNALHPWPASYTHAAVLTHDVETLDGFKRIDALAKLEEDAGLRSAWYIIPHKYDIDLGLLADLQARGHEIGVHGYNHDGRLFTSKRRFDRRCVPINRAMAKFSATGFRAPMVHRELSWMQQIEMDYDASCFDIDPYQAMPGGVGGVWPFLCGKFVELPYTLPQDHTLLTLDRLSHEVWIEKYELVRKLRGMALLITHPDYLITEKSLDEYRQFLAFVAADTKAFRCLPHEVARWWRQRDSETPSPSLVSIPLSELFSEL